MNEFVVRVDFAMTPQKGIYVAQSRDDLLEMVLAGIDASPVGRVTVERNNPPEIKEEPGA